MKSSKLCRSACIQLQTAAIHVVGRVVIAWKSAAQKEADKKNSHQNKQHTKSVTTKQKSFLKLLNSRVAFVCFSFTGPLGIRERVMQ